MHFINWDSEIDASISVCDEKGVIVYLNEKAIIHFEKDGGDKLVGANILDCHPEPAKSKLKELLISQKSNIYSIEKNGVKKIIIQKPWYSNGVYKGFVEFVTEIPKDMPHFVRM
jgi:transcriptional regulator with PAS, ATPase and Fis domain